MAGRAKVNLPGGSLKDLFVYLKVRIFKCSYRHIYIYSYICIFIIYIYIYVYMYIYIYTIQIPTASMEIFRLWDCQLQLANFLLAPASMVVFQWDEIRGIYGRWRIKDGDYYGDWMVFHWILWWFNDDLMGFTLR